MAPDDVRPGEKPGVVTLAATDPANPYGAALPWPTAEAGEGGHRPGRKAGALAVLVDGRLVVYVERGGRTLLTFPGSDDGTDPVELLTLAFDDLAGAVRRGALGRLTVERADGVELLGGSDRSTALRRALEAAGFVATPRGLRIRG
jgi:ATP-dependent Lhr-like helicase